MPSYLLAGTFSEGTRERLIAAIEKRAARLETRASPSLSFMVAGDVAGLSKKRMQEVSQYSNIVVLSVAEALTKLEPTIYSYAGSRELDRDIPSPPPELEPVAVSQLLTDVAAPKCVSEIVGNSRGVATLQNWLATWSTQPHKAILISGQAGIGKTTAAHLVAETCGYTVLELNASDSRNKKSVEEIMYDAISTPSVSTHGVVHSKPHCIIMDECDGMSAGDIGGAAALVKVIRLGRAPIICICNDKYAPAVKTLKPHCLAVDFWPLRANECVRRLEEIIAKQHLEVDSRVVKRIVSESNGDLRRMLTLLHVTNLVASSTSLLSQIDSVDEARADRELSPYAAMERLGDPRLSVCERDDIYWASPDMLDLYVHENSLPASAGETSLAALSHSFDTMALGDCVAQTMATSQQFTLMPAHAMFSVVAPMHVLSKARRRKVDEAHRIEFPAVLGQSSTAKRRRHSAVMLASRFRVSVDDLSLVQTLLVDSLATATTRDEAIDVAKTVRAAGLNGEDFDDLVEVCTLKSLRKVPPTNRKAFNAELEKLPDSFLATS